LGVYLRKKKQKKKKKKTKAFVGVGKGTEKKTEGGVQVPSYVTNDSATEPYEGNNPGEREEKISRKKKTYYLAPNTRHEGCQSTGKKKKGGVK